MESGNVRGVDEGTPADADKFGKHFLPANQRSGGHQVGGVTPVQQAVIAVTLQPNEIGERQGYFVSSQLERARLLLHHEEVVK